MRITLVNPPYPKRQHSHPPFIPLGIAYLGAVAEKAGHQVTAIDCQAEKLDQTTYQQRIAKENPDVVGVTATTLLYTSAQQIITTTKKTHPECITMLGGSHASFWDENALQENPNLDIVVRREGEATFLELLERLEHSKPLNGTQGATHRNKDGTITRNPDRPFIQNLDELPFPAYHLLPLQAFHRMGKTIFPLTTSRGCVYWCDFCSTVRMFGRGYRMRSPKNVVDEMEKLHNTYGETQYTFYDDAFTVNPDHTRQFCQELKNRHLSVQWDCETRVDMVNRELLQTMKNAGCMAIWFGVESGSATILDKMNKKIKTEQTKEAFKNAHDVGLMTIASTVIGFPGETEETAWETINFIKKLNPDDIGFYVATPYPGTPMYEQVKAKGWLKTTDFDKYDTATPTFETPWLSMEKIKEIRYKAHQQFYLRPGYVLRMLGKGGTYGVSAVKTSGAYLLRALHLKLS